MTDASIKSWVFVFVSGIIACVVNIRVLRREVFASKCDLHTNRFHVVTVLTAEILKARTTSQDR